MSSGSSSRADRRKRCHKIGIDADEARRRRENDLVQIRKNKRFDCLIKKRRDAESETLLPHPFPSSHSFMQYIPTMAQQIGSGSTVQQLEAATQFRKLLSRGNPPIDEVIKAGIIPHLVEFLDRYDEPKLQLEAARTLINVSSGTSDHTRVLIECGAVPKLVQLLIRSPDVDIKEDAMWVLGNISGDSPCLRDYVLDHGALPPLLSQFNPFSRLSMLKTITWTLCSLCRGKPPSVDLEQIKPALPVLRQLIFMADEEVLKDACWALSYISDGPSENIQATIDSDVCSRLADLLLHPSSTVILPAIRTIGNIVSGDESQTQHVADKQILLAIHQLLRQDQQRSILQEACWTISNITAGTIAQVQAVIETDIILSLVGLLPHVEFEIKKEITWAISNAAFKGSDEQLKILASQGCIKALCDMLTWPDLDVLSLCLEGLNNILAVGEAKEERRTHQHHRDNLFAQMVDECGGWEKIQNLQTHDNDEIFGRSVIILEKFWPEDELEGDGDPVDLSLALKQPDIPQGGFNFGS